MQIQITGLSIWLETRKDLRRCTAITLNSSRKTVHVARQLIFIRRKVELLNHHDWSIRKILIRTRLCTRCITARTRRRICTRNSNTTGVRPLRVNVASGLGVRPLYIFPLANMLRFFNAVCKLLFF